LPTLSLTDTIKRLEAGHTSPARGQAPVKASAAMESVLRVESSEQPPETSPAECSNAEDYEFDESQDFDNSTDGMGVLVVEPGKSGYMGPQSGVAALKFLQSLHLSVPLDSTSPFLMDEPDTLDMPAMSSPHISRYIDDYFLLYHTAYPILHEGTFRARVSGA
jgi:transcriptional regulatory protein GAL4